MRGIVLSDLDGTHFRETLEISLTDHLIAKGMVRADAFAKSTALRRAWKTRDSSYEQVIQAHWPEMSDGLKSLSVEAVRQMAREMIIESGNNVYTFTHTLIRVLKSMDFVTIAISGSTKDAAEIFGEHHGYDRVIATQYGSADGVYTGGVTYWPGENAKRDIALKILKEYDVSAEQTIAIGDTANDIGMLRSVCYPIAFNATRELELLVRSGSSEWRRPIGMVTERKDRLRIERFVPDLRSRPQARECPLEDLLPKDVAEELRKRLGTMCAYDTNWP